MEKLKVGFIGSGAIAQGQHMPAFAKLDNVEIAAVCDANEDSAKEAAKKFNVPHVFTDYKSMLKLNGLDVIDICTPNYLHKQPAIDALESGRHVIVEKPIAMNAVEGAEMVEAAKKAGKKLCVIQNMRFVASSQCLKRFVDAGDMGEMYFAKVTAIRRRGIPGWGVFTQKDKQGGGPLIDIGVHMLDLCLWLMGHPKPISASGQCYTKFGTREGLVGLFGQWDPKIFTVEDFAVGFVRFENGATLVLESSFAANIERDVMSVQILGTEGGFESNPLRIYREERKTLVDLTPVFLPNVNGHEAEIRQFVDAIVNDTEVPVPGEQALMTTKILDAIYQSSEVGREVEIS